MINGIWKLGTVSKKVNHKVKCKFCNQKRIKMPYEEIYFQRLEEDNPEDYDKLKSNQKKVLSNLWWI